MDDVKVTPRCFYCHAHESDLQEDHVVPFSRGGSSLPRNLVLACVSCNAQKSDRLPSEWRSDLHDRVYQLERDLVEWHAGVDARRARAAASIAVGFWVAIGIKVLKGQPEETVRGRVVGLDSRGIRIAPVCLASSIVHAIREYAEDLADDALHIAVELERQPDVLRNLVDRAQLASSEDSPSRWLPWSDVDWLLTSEDPIEVLPHQYKPSRWVTHRLPIAPERLDKVLDSWRAGKSQPARSGGEQ